MFWTKYRNGPGNIDIIVSLDNENKGSGNLVTNVVVVCICIYTNASQYALSRVDKMKSILLPGPSGAQNNEALHF